MTRQQRNCTRGYCQQARNGGNNKGVGRAAQAAKDIVVCAKGGKRIRIDGNHCGFATSDVQ